MRRVDMRRRLLESARRAGREQAGFTLVEAMVAGMILVVGLLSMVGVFNDTRDQGATAERHEIAVMQAQQALEEMRGQPYENLALNAGAVDPTGAGRLTGSGADFQVKPDLAEPLVYPATEGIPTEQAWVDPVSTVSINPETAPVDLTIHRYVTWRDEECGLIDLDGLGLDLPAAIDQTQGPLLGLVDGVLDELLGLLSGSNRQLIQSLQNRLDGLQQAFLDHEGELTSAISGLTELDLCDLDLALLDELQSLHRLTPALIDTGGLSDLLGDLDDALSGVCLPLLGCLLSNATDEIEAVNDQLDCMFGEGSDYPDFESYLAGVTSGLQSLTGDLADTPKNTKRIAVAVVVEPRSGVGPFEPVWASSVVRDPAAGLLSGGGVLC